MSFKARTMEEVVSARNGSATTRNLDVDAGEAGERSGSALRHQAGRKVCALSSVRLATEHRMLSKEGGSLLRAGYRVTIVAPHPRDEVIDGIAIKAVPISSSRFSRIVRSSWTVYREALRQRADVYHFHNVELIPMGWLLKLHGKRVFYDVREDTPADLSDKYWIPAWVRPLVVRAVDLAEKISGKILDGIVAATPHIGERFPASNTVVVQNFPMLDEVFPPACPYLERSPSVLYIGSISPTRGVLELVDAMGLLPETVPARLVIGGEFDPAEMEQEAHGKLGWKRTDYLGRQNRRGLLELFSRARVGVIPFLVSPNHNDVQPIKLFEYMLAGLPVVASKLPRVAEIIKQAECGILVEPGKPQEMAEAIRWMLEHPQDAMAMGMRGRKAVLATYNWNSQAQLLLQLYRRVTG
jgi:glycosyltransferase involved in cell wall biosynthesis